MCNLESNIAKVFELAKSFFNVKLDEYNNLRHYPNKPKVSDIQIIAVSIAAELERLDSENGLYIELERSCPKLFVTLPHRTNFNRRKKSLRLFFDEFASTMADLTTLNSKEYIIDSMPLPVCRLARSRRIKIMKADTTCPASKGFLPIDKFYFFGYKLHVVTSETGVIINYCLTQAHAHDVSQLSELSSILPAGCRLLGDKGYISKPLQLDLFKRKKVKVVTPLRANQNSAVSEWTKANGRARKRIETVFSQLIDAMKIKNNYAKELHGLLTRITVKIATFTMCQYLNNEYQRPINNVKNFKFC